MYYVTSLMTNDILRGNTRLARSLPSWPLCQDSLLQGFAFDVLFFCCFLLLQYRGFLRLGIEMDHLLQPRKFYCLLAPGGCRKIFQCNYCNMYTVIQLTGYIGLEAVEARSSGYPTGQQASCSISPTNRRNISQPCPQNNIFG